MQGLKYGAEDSNVLDVASTPTERSVKRPIVVFFTGGFGEGNGPASELVTQAMCFAADHGLVAFRVRYPGADQAARPEGAKDAAAAISWVFENADLFAGNAHEIVVIGFAAGASPLVDIVVRKRFVIDDACVAGLVLVSAVFRSADGAADRWNGTHPASTPSRLRRSGASAQAATAALDCWFAFQFQGSRSATLLAG